MTAITEPRVELISSPENLKKIIYTACRTCTSTEGAGAIWEEINKEIAYNNKCIHKCLDSNFRYFCKPQDDLQLDKDRICDFSLIEQKYENKFSPSLVIDCKNEQDNFKNYVMAKEIKNQKMFDLILKVINSGHHSVLEHVYLVFTIDNISRACTHQIVRHRHMSFSQKSQRYVTEKGQFGYVIPPTVKGSELEEEYIKFMGQTSEFYAKMIERGIPAEDARMMLPNAATSSMVASLNLRELIHLANERLCTRAQKEIREVVKKMCKRVIKKEPWLKEYLTPKCYGLGYCEEHKSCLDFPKKAQHGKTFWKAGE